MAGVRVAVRVTQEATYGTYDASASTANKMTLLLPGDSAFEGMMTPTIWRLRSAGYDGRQVRQGTKQWDAKCSVKTKLFPAQADFMLRLASGIGLSSNCRTFPSATIDYRYILEDSGCTIAVERYYGCQVASFNMNANNQGDGVQVTADVNWVCQKRLDGTGTDFPEPAGSDYPATDPFLFQDSVGTLTVGSSITNYASLNLAINNVIQRRWDESTYPMRGKWRSRDITLAIGLLYKDNTFRNAMENQTALAVSYRYINALADNLLIDLKSQNYVDPFARTFPLQGDFEQTVTLRNNLDIGAGTDFSFTYTPHP